MCFLKEEGMLSITITVFLQKKKKAIFNLNLIKLLVLTSRLEETQVIEEQFMISQGNHETNPECVYLEIN